MVMGSELTLRMSAARTPLLRLLRLDGVGNHLWRFSAEVSSRYVSSGAFGECDIQLRDHTLTANR